jgi:LacI family transcriptional regulator
MAKVTIKTLAEELNLSVCTINKGLNNKPRISPETRRRVQEAAERLGYRPNRLAQALVRAPHMIEVVYPDAWSSHYGLLAEGVGQRVAELQDHHITVNFRLVPGFDKGDQFVEIVRQVAESECKGVIICLGMYNQCDQDEAWKILGDHHIPFVLLGNDCENSPYLAWVGIDGLRSGKMAGELLGWSIPHGSVAIMVGTHKNPEHYQKIEGFESEISRYSLNMAGVYEAGDVPEMSKPVTARLFAEHPDLKGLYVATDNVAGVCQYLLDNNLVGKVKVVATGRSPEVLKMIEQGVINCSLFQNEQQQGRLAVHMLHQWFETNEIRPQKKISVPPVVLMRNTVDLWSNDKIAPETAILLKAS